MMAAYFHIDVNNDSQCNCTVKQLLTYSYAEIAQHIYTCCNNSSVLHGGKKGTISMNLYESFFHLNTFKVHDLEIKAADKWCVAMTNKVSLNYIKENVIIES